MDAQNFKTSKLFTTPETNLVFTQVEAPTSQAYIDDRKAGMNKLQKEIEGYSDAYFSLAKYHV